MPQCQLCKLQSGAGADPDAQAINHDAVSRLGNRRHHSLGVVRVPQAVTNDPQTGTALLGTETEIWKQMSTSGPRLRPVIREMYSSRGTPGEHVQMWCGVLKSKSSQICTSAVLVRLGSARTFHTVHRHLTWFTLACREQSDSRKFLRHVENGLRMSLKPPCLNYSMCILTVL